MQTYITKRGVLFTLHRSSPYKTKDGRMITLDYWRSPCRHENCTDYIEVGAPPGANLDGFGNFNRAHCEAHKVTKAEASAIWAAACAKSNTKATPDDVARIYKMYDEGVPVSVIVLLSPVGQARIYALLAARKKQT